MARQTFIIEISPGEGYTSACRLNGLTIAPKSELGQALRDCVKPGDCQDVCKYVLQTWKPVFRTVRKTGSTYENAVASDSELQTCCETIYFESDTDFADRDNAELYLVWQAASDYAESLRNAE